MRYHRMRFDIWLCLLIAYLVAMGVGKVIDYIAPSDYQQYEQKHVVADGEIGGKADKKVFKAKSVKDLLSHDTFTIVSKGIKFQNEGAGYFDGKYLYNVELSSGERIAAYINTDAVQRTGKDIYSGDSILPVGRVTYANLEESEDFLNQIEHGHKLSRKDFYIDMVGEAQRMSEEDYDIFNKTIPQIIAGIIAFGGSHMLASKLGIFPAFFSFKKKKESEWD